MRSDLQIINRCFDLVVSAFFDAKPFNAMKGYASLVTQHLVDESGRNNIERPLIEIHRIGCRSIGFGKEAEDVNLRTALRRRVISAYIPVSILKLANIAVVCFGNGKHRL